ncbi:hypothetical protein PSTG_09679 [Puccinia striiformis f. sp. tritici PST-78]|uniref:Core-binding (CB) domain-containing protein n=1 Tax=Puccinia striiformis f. sp. tritici PST-78 TaxID=1165861 RepID=A0A0L0VCV8_9BASI|nr:hypothetical protein PSTG_09679 [Puccinia striiformis f. sp. tritici PST-78]
MININKLSAFTADGNHPKKPSKDNVHYLHVFTKNTSIGYKTAVKKFNKSMVANRPTDHNVAAKTLTKYLSGLKAWHTYHRKPYPTSVEQRSSVYIRSSARTNPTFPVKPKKGAVHLSQLVYLAEQLGKGNAQERAILDLALIVFWGMAWLAELTYPVWWFI